MEVCTIYSNNIHVHQMSEHHWRLTQDNAPAYVCMDLIIGTKRALLIDTGYGNAALSDTVKTLTHLPLTIAISHAHADHMGGVFEFKQPILISEDEYLRIISDTESQFFPSVRHYFEKSKPVLLTEHQSIDLGGIDFETIKTPGHTPGCISFYNKTNKELFSSDSLCPAIMLWEPLNQSIQQLKTTAKKLSHMNIHRLWTGHQKAPFDEKAVSIYIETILGQTSMITVKEASNIQLCTSSRWIKHLEGKNISEIYRDYVNSPEFSCIFLMGVKHQ